MKTRAAVLLAATSLAWACSSPSGPSTPPPVGDTVWMLRTLQQGGRTVAAPDPQQYTVRFREGGRLEARVSCNSCGGTYTLMDTRLRVSDMFCTLALCTPPGLDGDYVGLLQTAVRAEVVDGELRLSGPNGELRFRR